jgi:hypothetical protein
MNWYKKAEPPEEIVPLEEPHIQHVLPNFQDKMKTWNLHFLPPGYKLIRKSNGRWAVLMPAKAGQLDEDADELVHDEPNANDAVEHAIQRMPMLMSSHLSRLVAIGRI